jgi:hypothetical protein
MEKSKRIEKAKWLGNADSPVMLMVDDFTNVWIDLNNNGKVDPYEDWGHAMDSPNSSFAFLNERILKDFPLVKATFFTPVARVPTTRDYQYKAHFGPINENEKIANFFRSVHRNNRFEIAYHGLTHGVPGERSEDFVQEWVAYKSLEEALEAIERGKRIYFGVFGEYPSGGKYCGYEYNAFSDESIDKSGFLWWCRRWDRGQAEGDTAKVDAGNISRFDIKYFGENKVIDIPSTIYGAMFNPLDASSITAAFGKRTTLRKGAAELDYLLRNKLVISIQEHISPARTDGKRQTPNIFDDVESLRLIFEHLDPKNVWYCTGTELAEYVYCRDNTTVEQDGDSLRFDLRFGRNIRRKLMTLIVNDDHVTQIRTPSGEIVRSNQEVGNVGASSRGTDDSKARNQRVFDVPIMMGKYDLL